MYVCCVCAGVLKGQKRASDPLARGSQANVSNLTWGLGTELRSSGRTTYALNPCSISPATEVNLNEYMCVYIYILDIYIKIEK